MIDVVIYIQMNEESLAKDYLPEPPTPTNNAELLAAIKRKLSQKQFPVDKILFLESMKGD